MDTPVCDFIREYVSSGKVRMHMPGHKGKQLIGPESLDITEVQGAGELYTGEGPVGRGEENTASLFGTAMTCWGTEGSSQCIRAMLALVTGYGAGSRTIIAARNVHRSFLTACALLDLQVCWLWPKEYSLCSCKVQPDDVKKAILQAQEKPAAVFLTSPDYLGRLQDITAIAQVCHANGIPLLVDNAHGAYLHFLPESLHPIHQGADLVCDSAHKTLPALTGCAYLHVAKTAPVLFKEYAKQAMAVFGSTSPSWLLLQSLDAVNAKLADSFSKELVDTVCVVNDMCRKLEEYGWVFVQEEPLKLTIDALQSGYRGDELAELLRHAGIEPEYQDPDYVVLMLSPSHDKEVLQHLEETLLRIGQKRTVIRNAMPFSAPEQIMLIRQAMFAPSEEVPLDMAEGRILASPALSCPPAISIVVSGERISSQAIRIMTYYGTDHICVVRDTI